MPSHEPPMPAISCVLVANRGEIASRVFRTARAMGLRTAAVYSDADRDLPFTADADVAVALGGNTSAESYLDQAKILAAAIVAGADAVHPGYGFLSENPAFAEAVAAAGLVWVGPTPASMRAMALKVEAKERAAAAGVPLVPGAAVDSDDEGEWAAAAGQVGYPLLVKASAGGGGKGMRRVDRPGELSEAVRAARREAASAFGDPRVFLERNLVGARHVEVQVFGDAHGGVVHLFERECSIQRRHQKIVEESPSPGLRPEVAEQMYSAATSLARDLGYVGAGTVEFLVAGEGGGQEFFFLEMNTRLQVEHPVTEAVTGLDLVRWQLQVAAGGRLPLGQQEIARHGHAIEARVYAEDPARGYLPSIGRLDGFAMRDPSVRFDSGYAAGCAVSPYYDPMLAKAIVHAPTRSEAAAVLARGLRTMDARGLVTNRDLLVAILDSAPYRAGQTGTDFLDAHPGLLQAGPGDEDARAHLLAAALAGAVLRRAGAQVQAFAPSGWRNVPALPQRASFTGPAGDVEVMYALAAGGSLTGTVAGRPAEGRLLGAQPWPDGDGASLDLEVDGVRRRLRCFRHGADDAPRWEVADGWWATTWRERSRFPDASADAGAHGPSTPVPGTVTVVLVAVGDAVEAGQTLVILEAMKMEHRITADVDGVVAELHVRPGQSVDAHHVVAVLG